MYHEIVVINSSMWVTYPDAYPYYDEPSGNGPSAAHTGDFDNERDY